MVFKVMVLDEVIQESVKLEEGDRGLSFGIFDVQRLKIGGEGISMENKKGVVSEVGESEVCGV